MQRKLASKCIAIICLCSTNHSHCTTKYVHAVCCTIFLLTFDIEDVSTVWCIQPVAVSTVVILCFEASAYPLRYRLIIRLKRLSVCVCDDFLETIAYCCKCGGDVCP